MEGKLKMVSLFAVLVVCLSATPLVLCLGDDESSLTGTETTTARTATEEEVLSTTTTRTTKTTTTFPAWIEGETSSPDLIISKKKSDLVKFGFYDKKKADRGLKPFVYGKKFELQNESNVNRYQPKGTGRQESLVSPLITSPIRLRPYVSRSGNFKKIRDSLRENVDESENVAAEVDTDVEAPGKRSGKKDPGWKTRRNGDRSLMVVLPFNPSDNGSVEELFTKKPLVRMMETDDLLKRKEDNKGPRTTVSPLRFYKDLVTTTEFDRKLFLTRKPWRPSKRFRPTTESYYPSTTESGEDVTKTYTTYNDVEQVTRKFQIRTGHEPAISNHKYDVDVVTSLPVKRLRTKTPALVQEDSNEKNPTIFVTTSTSEKPSEMFDLLGLDGGKPKDFKPKKKIQRKTSTTTTTEDPSNVEGLKKVLEILPADMKDVILELDLNKEEKAGGNEGTTTADSISGKKQVDGGDDSNGKLINLKTIVQPPIDPKSYAVFKPIPLEMKEEKKNSVSEDMKAFLASFGLLTEGKRQQKSMKTADRKDSNEFSGANLNFLPEDMKSVLRDMGLMKYGNDNDSPSIHIFNPSNHSVAQSDEDFEKVKSILTSIKTTVNESKPLTQEMQLEIIQKIKDLNELRYKTGNITEINDAIKKIVFNRSREEAKARQTRRATKLTDGPNPLLDSEEEYLAKNDVKRQSSSSSSSSASSSSNGTSSSAASSSSSSSSANSRQDQTDGEEDTETTTAVTTTTEETPNLEALRDSFGGGETASDNEDVDSALPPKRPNGLYFLFDWNSFLEVGTEDDNRRVNLRFQPKIGDSRNFLPVSVP